MFEHLKKEKPLPLKTRLTYLSVAAVGVATAFALSLWLIAQFVSLFVRTPGPPSPVPVHFDADGDGIPLNELDPVEEEPSNDEVLIPAEPTPKESEKASPPQ